MDCWILQYSKVQRTRQSPWVEQGQAAWVKRALYRKPQAEFAPSTRHENVPVWIQGVCLVQYFERD